MVDRVGIYFFHTSQHRGVGGLLGSELLNANALASLPLQRLMDGGSKDSL